MPPQTHLSPISPPLMESAISTQPVGRIGIGDRLRVLVTSRGGEAVIRAGSAGVDPVLAAFGSRVGRVRQVDNRHAACGYRVPGAVGVSVRARTGTPQLPANPSLKHVPDCDAITTCASARSVMSK